MKKVVKSCLLGLSVLTLAVGTTACEKAEKITYADTYNDKTVSTVYEEVGAELETLVNQETRNYQVNMNMSMVDKICGQTEYAKASISMSMLGASVSTASEAWYADETMYLQQTTNGQTTKQAISMSWSEYEEMMQQSVSTSIYDVDPSALENVQFAIGDKNGCRFTVTITGEYMQPILDEAFGMVENSGENLPFEQMTCSDIDYTIYVNGDGTFKKMSVVFDMVMIEEMEDDMGTMQTMTYTMSFNITTAITNIGKISPITPPADAGTYLPY